MTLKITITLEGMIIIMIEWLCFLLKSLYLQMYAEIVKEKVICLELAKNHEGTGEETKLVMS